MNTKTKKTVLIILIIAISVLLLAGIVTAILLIPLQGKKNNYEWSNTDTFNVSENVFTIENAVGEDFNILQLTDMQLWSGGRDNKETFALCERLIRAEKPELVMLTGDNVSGITAPYLLKDLIKFMDNLAKELDFYWAPVFGNHDNEVKATPNWSADKYIEANQKNGKCLFAKGPSNLGDDNADLVGNYVINVKEGNKIIQSLYMMDTSSYIENSAEDINAKQAIYNGDKFSGLSTVEKEVLSRNGSEMYITDKQIEWFKWNASNIKALNNQEFVPAMTFTHFALNGVDKGFDEMYLNAKNSNYEGSEKFLINSAKNGHGEDSTYYTITKDLGEQTAMSFNATDSGIKGFGSYQYKPGVAVKDTGFTAIAKEYGLYGCFFGHDHENDAIMQYNGVIYGYGLKAGPSPKPWNGSRYFGGTTLTIRASEEFRLNVKHNIDQLASEWWGK